MPDKEPTIYDVLEAINEFSTKIDQRFEKIEADMVTKSYLDEKLGDLKGDMVAIVRKEDRKLGELVDVLEEKEVISKEDEKRVMSLEPFPKMCL